MKMKTKTKMKRTMSGAQNKLSYLLLFKTTKLKHLSLIRIDIVETASFYLFTVRFGKFSDNDHNESMQASLLLIKPPPLVSI